MMVAKLALRTEDALNQVLQEHQYVMHFQPGPDSIIPILLRASQKWHKEEKTTSLKHVLSSLMIQTLLAKVETLAMTPPEEPLWQVCQAKGLIDSQGNMPFLRWNDKNKKLEPSKEASITITEIVRFLQNLQRLVQDPMTTFRCHSLVKTEDSDRSSLAIYWEFIKSS